MNSILTISQILLLVKELWPFEISHSVIFFIFLNNWMFYVLTFQMLSPFPPLSPPTHFPCFCEDATAPFHPPTPTSTPWHSPTLGKQTFTGPRIFPPIDARLGYPLIHMQLEP